MNTKPQTESWIAKIAGDKPLVISGPCSAETEDQVLQIAHQLRETGTHIFRAGIWKPRTRPGSFEGIGKSGLQWLQRVKKETGFLTATEVATKEHVALAMAAEIDVLWLGARTTVSPFMVQEIADALQGTDTIVLVKNPVSPDLSLWLGAIERLQKAGIQNLGTIHRGFSAYIKTKYRNNPEWQIAIDLKNNFPEIPMLIDPSHMGGRRDLIANLSQTGLDLNYDGLMVETHIDPDNAWSDAAQQITPAAFSTILQQLTVRKPEEAEKKFSQKIDQLRLQIDAIDSQIMTNLGKRMKIAGAIGVLKKQNNVAILQSKRWQEVLERMKTAGKTEELSEEFITEIFKAIHQESIEHQHRISDNNQ
jgi:chorismate mutase